VAEQTTYFAIIGVGRTSENPSGIARRRITSDGRVDESFRRDLTWGPTTAVTDWEYGNLPGELTEISQEQADLLIRRFRENWDKG
jgi:hypothetical protein